MAEFTCHSATVLYIQVYLCLILLLRRGGGSAMTLSVSTTMCCDGSGPVLAAVSPSALSIGELEDELSCEPGLSMMDDFSLTS